MGRSQARDGKLPHSEAISKDHLGAAAIFAMLLYRTRTMEGARSKCFLGKLEDSEFSTSTRTVRTVRYRTVRYSTCNTYRYWYRSYPVSFQFCGDAVCTVPGTSGE